MGYVSSKEGDYARAAKLGAECGGDTLKNNLTARAKRHVAIYLGHARSHVVVNMWVVVARFRGGW